MACGEEFDETLEHPSTAIKLGFDISRMLTSKIGYCIKQGDKEGIKHCLDVERLMKDEWTYKVNKLASVTLNERKFNKRIKLPLPEDIAKLSMYLIKEILNLHQKMNNQDDVVFRHAIILAEARLLLFNKRRPGELESMSIKGYKDRSTEVDDVELSLRDHYTDLEREMLKSQHLVEIRGKCGKGVPVIIPQDTVVLMNYLVDPKSRQNAGIKKENTYVFANSALSVVRAGNSLDEIKYKADLEAPERITATKLWKYTATISQVIGLKDNQVEWLCKHMGHTMDVHKAYYRATSGMIERMEIAKLMLIQERNKVGRFAGRDLSKVTFDEIIDDDQETENEDNQDQCKGVTQKSNSEIIDNDQETENEDHQDQCKGVTQKSNSVVEIIDGDQETENEDHQDQCKGVTQKSNSVSATKKRNRMFLEDDGEATKVKKTKKVERIAWSREEENEIQKYLGHLIKKRKCPGKEDCVTAMKKSKSGSGLIHKRNWETLKKKVSNMIQRQRKS